jgi:hypothetical protein
MIRYAARLIFANDEHSTSNTTEYEALLLAIRKMKLWVSKPSSYRQTPKSFKSILKKRAKKEILF